ncbi:uncharacterized protein BcabD6B2_21300 [Babesia caballi]|uniref:Uncharacterized protein n=1 Tax=Babesia caballi TaxID=5871 RepID=A0AAV4LS19_BABCB|nr:hypothetical protein, conserved [Babesia caballi]
MPGRPVALCSGAGGVELGAAPRLRAVHHDTPVDSANHAPVPAGEYRVRQLPLVQPRPVLAGHHGHQQHRAVQVNPLDRQHPRAPLRGLQHALERPAAAVAHAAHRVVARRRLGVGVHQHLVLARLAVPVVHHLVRLGRPVVLVARVRLVGDVALVVHADETPVALVHQVLVRRLRQQAHRAELLVRRVLDHVRLRLVRLVLLAVGPRLVAQQVVEGLHRLHHRAPEVRPPVHLESRFHVLLHHRPVLVNPPRIGVFHGQLGLQHLLVLLDFVVHRLQHPHERVGLLGDEAGRSCVARVPEQHVRVDGANVDDVLQGAPAEHRLRLRRVLRGHQPVFQIRRRRRLQVPAEAPHLDRRSLLLPVLGLGHRRRQEHRHRLRQRRVNVHAPQHPFKVLVLQQLQVNVVQHHHLRVVGLLRPHIHCREPHRFVAVTRQHERRRVDEGNVLRDQVRPLTGVRIRGRRGGYLLGLHCDRVGYIDDARFGLHGQLPEVREGIHAPVEHQDAPQILVQVREAAQRRGVAEEVGAYFGEEDLVRPPLEPLRVLLVPLPLQHSVLVAQACDVVPGVAASLAQGRQETPRLRRYRLVGRVPRHQKLVNLPDRRAPPVRRRLAVAPVLLAVRPPLHRDPVGPRDRDRRGRRRSLLRLRRRFPLPQPPRLQKLVLLHEADLGVEPALDEVNFVVVHVRLAEEEPVAGLLRVRLAVVDDDDAVGVAVQVEVVEAIFRRALEVGVSGPAKDTPLLILRHALQREGHLVQLGEAGLVHEVSASPEAEDVVLVHEVVEEREGEARSVAVDGPSVVAVG